jgi:hypothetical protein
MGGIYRPGWQSRTYRQYSRTFRASIAAEVDRLFREKTGVARQLDPTSHKDLELRRVWLRIRDQVVAERERKLDEEFYKPGGAWEQLEADRRDSLLTAIPGEMEWNHWHEGAQLLETWFERPPAIAPNYSAPITNLIKMDWVLQFARAKTVFDQIVKGRIWTNVASQQRLRELLRKLPPTASTFGNLTQPVTQIDDAWVNSRPVSSGGVTPDGLTAALGGFQLQVAVAGKVSRLPGGVVSLTVEEVGIYVKDSFDFNGDQFLGVWGYRDDPVNNLDFRQWRSAHNMGGDFQVFSDVKRLPVVPPDVVLVTP